MGNQVVREFSNRFNYSIHQNGMGDELAMLFVLALSQKTKRVLSYTHQTRPIRRRHVVRIGSARFPVRQQR